MIRIHLVSTTLVLELNENSHLSTIQDVKDQVHEKWGVQPEQQHLSYDGKELLLDKTLGDYNIPAEATIGLTLCLEMEPTPREETSGKDFMALSPRKLKGVANMRSVGNKLKELSNLQLVALNTRKSTAKAVTSAAKIVSGVTTTVTKSTANIGGTKSQKKTNVSATSDGAANVGRTKAQKKTKGFSLSNIREREQPTPASKNPSLRAFLLKTNKKHKKRKKKEYPDTTTLATDFAVTGETKQELAVDLGNRQTAPDDSGAKIAGDGEVSSFLEDRKVGGQEESHASLETEALEKEKLTEEEQQQAVSATPEMSGLREQEGFELDAESQARIAAAQELCHSQDQAHGSVLQKQHVQQEEQQRTLLSPLDVALGGSETKEMAAIDPSIDGGVGGDLTFNIETEQMKDSAEETGDEEEEVAANNWLAQALRLASRLWNARNQEDELEEPEEPEQDGKSNAQQSPPQHHGDEGRIVRETMGSYGRTESNVKEECNYQYYVDDDSISTRDSDIITVADVVSLAEQSLEKASTSEQRQALLQLKSVLTKLIKQTPKVILVGEPNRVVDGDSEGQVGNNSKENYLRRQQAELSVAAKNGDEKSNHRKATRTVQESLSHPDNSTPQCLVGPFPVERSSRNDDVASRITQVDEGMAKKSENDGQNDLAVKIDDKKDPLMHQAELSMAAKKCNEKSNRLQPKWTVETTLKSIHRLLRYNLRSSAENKQAPASTKPKKEEKGLTKKLQSSHKRGRQRSGSHRGFISRSRSSSDRGFISRSRSSSDSGSQRAFTVRGRSQSSSREDTTKRSNSQSQRGSPPTGRPLSDQSGKQRGITSKRRSRSRSRSVSLTRHMKDQSGRLRGFPFKGQCQGGTPSGQMMDQDRAPSSDKSLGVTGKPPSQTQLLIDIHSGETRVERSSSQTELRVDAALARNRSESPTRRANGTGGMTTQTTQKEEICSAASGFDVGRRRSRSSSTHIKDQNGVKLGRQNPPTRRQKKCQTSDDGLRTRRRPCRTKSDGSRRRTLARTKSNEEARKEKSSRSGPRKTTSFDGGCTSFGNLGLDSMRDSAFHESFPSIAPKRGRSTRRSSISTVYTGGLTSSIKEPNFKPRKFSPSHFSELLSRVEDVIGVSVSGLVG